MHNGKTLQFERLLFFSDAVFAIAITLLVIEIRLPHVDTDDSRAMLQALLSLIPNYIGFLISFLVVGRFWIGHHAQFAHVETTDRAVVWRNLLFLGVIAFMPFPTAVLVEHAGSAVGVIFYSGWLMLAGLLNWFLFSRVVKITVETHGAAGIEQRAQLRGAWMPVLIGATAAGAALLAPIAGLGVLIFSPLIMRVFQWLARPKS